MLPRDFNEYQTKHLSFAATPAAQPHQWSGIGPRRYGALPATDLTRLRTELYGLKDEIQISVEKLRRYRTCLPSSASSIAGDVINCFGEVFNAISLALTNNGSEWLDWGISGDGHGLTHAEFCALDPLSIRDFSDRLRQICEVLDIEQDPHIKAMWTEQMVQDHRAHMLMEEGQLEALESLVAVLTAVLMPNRS
jgi:hypothetical protein